MGAVTRTWRARRTRSCTGVSACRGCRAGRCAQRAAQGRPQPGSRAARASLLPRSPGRRAPRRGPARRRRLRSSGRAWHALAGPGTPRRGRASRAPRPCSPGRRARRSGSSAAAACSAAAALGRALILPYPGEGAPPVRRAPARRAGARGCPGPARQRHAAPPQL